MSRHPRQNPATRSLPPATLADIERYLDLVADLMLHAGEKAYLLLPIWRRLEREREARQQQDAVIAQAKARALRLQDRTAEQSS